MLPRSSIHYPISLRTDLLAKHLLGKQMPAAKPLKIQG